MMKAFSAVVEKCSQTGLFVGYVPGLPGAHTQAETFDELQQNLREVLAMLLDEVHREGKLSINFYLSNPCTDS